MQLQRACPVHAEVALMLGGGLAKRVTALLLGVLLASQLWLCFLEVGEAEVHLGNAFL